MFFEMFLVRKTRQLNRCKPWLTGFGSMKANAELAKIMESEQPASGPGLWLEKMCQWASMRIMCHITYHELGWGWNMTINCW
jgi:hypothetical protein